MLDASNALLTSSHAMLNASNVTGGAIILPCWNAVGWVQPGLLQGTVVKQLYNCYTGCYTAAKAAKLSNRTSTENSLGQVQDVAVEVHGMTKLV